MSEEDSEEARTSSPVGREEETRMFNLLFQKCNINDSGWANVDTLVNTIREMVPGGPSSTLNEEDTNENVGGIQYNLDLLKCMLENHSINGEINEASYNHVIRSWVKNVRSNSQSPNTSKELSSTSNEDEFVSPIKFSPGSSRSIELASDVGNLSIRSVAGDMVVTNEEEANDGVVTVLFQESFETTGGGSSSHELDYQQLVNTISDLQLDNKRIQERNQRLIAQIEVAEENARQVQSENIELANKIKSQQQSMSVFESVKQEKTELGEKLMEEEKLSEELKEAIEEMNHEINDLRSQISDLQNQLTSSQTEKDDIYHELHTMQQKLAQTEERMEQIENERALIEVRLEERSQEAISLHKVLSNTEEEIKELRHQNTNLHGQLSQPVISTPFRPMAPSLHEELAGCGIVDMMSPVMVDSSLDDITDPPNINGKHDDIENDENFPDISHKLSEAKAKFNEKASLMRQQLSDLIDTPLTSVGNTEKNKPNSFMSSKENMDEVFETKLRKFETGKKRDRQKAQKLSEELDKLKKENEELKERCRQLQELIQERGSTDRIVGVEATPSDVHLLLTSQPPQITSYVPEEFQEPLLVTATVGIQTEGMSVQTTANTPLYITSLEEGHEGIAQPIEDITPVSSSREETPVPFELMTSAEQEERLENVLLHKVHESPQLLSISEPELKIIENEVPPVQKPRRSCLILLLTFIVAIVKVCIWSLLVVTLILTLIVLLVSFNSTLGRCGGRYCSDSPLQMLLGQHLQYIHTGEVPV